MLRNRRASCGTALRSLLLVAMRDKFFELLCYVLSKNRMEKII
jgi:hypothetical protein